MKAAAIRSSVAMALLAAGAAAYDVRTSWTLAGTVVAVGLTCLPGPRAVWRRVGGLVAVLFAVAAIALAPSVATWL